MTHAASVLCPIDFSPASRGALRYATAIAEHFGAELIVLTVTDPLLTEVAELKMGPAWLPGNIERELARFLDETFDHQAHVVKPTLIVASGKPASEILATAKARACDVVVMSSHGVTGIRKFFFGATTERVLRETTIPVLVTPASDNGPKDLSDLRATGRPVLIPVDLTDASTRQVKVARAVAQALGVPLLLAHVIKPLRFPVPMEMPLPTVDAERRTRAEAAMGELAAAVPPSVTHEALIAHGDPAEEVAKIAHDRHAGLIIMGLHATTGGGPRMGSVTYRVLCLAPTPVLALPPATSASASPVTD